MKLASPSGEVFVGTVEQFNELKTTNPNLYAKFIVSHNNDTDKLSQEEINEFTPEQMDVLFENNIISKDEYQKAKRFWRDCLIAFQTRLEVILEINRIIAMPRQLLRCESNLAKLFSMNLVTAEDCHFEIKRRNRVLNLFNKLTNQETKLIQQNHTINFTNFVVLSNVFKCNKNHHIEPIRATVNVLTPSGTIQNLHVSAGHCIECGIFFILESDYNRLSQLGVLLCRKLTRDVYVSNGDSIISGDEFNTESLLHQIGYNVNSQEGLTSEQRQNLLKLAIDNGLYSISGLLSFLDWLIARNKKVLNRDMSQAISKWTEDRFFVANYKNNTQRKVGVDAITVKNDDLPF